jgi:Ca-activated chloride channel family protein
MSFGTPLVLLALLAIPLLAAAYLGEQRRRGRLAAAFVTAPLVPSVAPRRPAWRRHVPLVAFALAVVALVLAAARPQHHVTVPVTGGAVMLAFDVSSSMASTDVRPSREVAAEHAAAQFTRTVPAALRVGMLKFNATATLLQTPSTDHALVLQALPGLEIGGHTAIGSALETAITTLRSLRSPAGKRIPGAIVVISDGTSDSGANPYAAAATAKQDHIPVYTVVVGTPHGTIAVPTGHGGTRSVPVPVNPSELQAIARDSGGQSFSASDAGRLTAVYAHLAARLGHKRVLKQITSLFAGLGLVLLLLGAALSLRWFGRFA